MNTYPFPSSDSGLQDSRRFPAAAFQKFLNMDYIVPAKDGDHLSGWQQRLDCDNRCFPAMEYTITGKCSYNCLHCFNAAGNAPGMSGWTPDEAKTMLEQAGECGINAITITGGEPMMHKNFFEIIEDLFKLRRIFLR